MNAPSGVFCSVADLQAIVVGGGVLMAGFASVLQQKHPRRTCSWSFRLKTGLAEKSRLLIPSVPAM
jgi:hypothetical protein